MRDYPNMSYCMNENTLGALEQLVEAMDEFDSPDLYIASLSDSERDSFVRLVALIQDISEQTDRSEIDLADKCWE